MTISTGDAIHKFGNQVEVTNGAIAITSGAVSTQANQVAWTNSDDAPEAELALVMTLAVALSDPENVDIFARKMDIQGVNDENQPSLTNEDKLVGTVNCGTDGTGQNKSTIISLENGVSSQQYEFYFKNGTSENISSLRAYITPRTSGPHA